MEAATNIIQIPQENQFKVVKFELTPEAITEMVKEYESLELIPGDKESYKTVHEAKMICVKARTGTDKHRKELGADARKWISDVNQAAQDLIAPLLPLEEKLKAMLEEEDNREAKIAQANAEKLAALMCDLEYQVKQGQAYNLAAIDIKTAIENLEAFEISAVDFDTETERAESLKAEGLETLGRILADRERWEAEQIEAEKVKAAQEAEAKKLADERAAFEAQQEAILKKQAEAQAILDAERKAAEDAAEKLRAMEAEKTRKENEKLQHEREALEKEKAAILAEKLAAEEKAKAETEAAQTQHDIEAAIIRNWDHAHEENAIFDAAWARAKEIDKDIEKKKLQADKARAKLIAEDKKSVQQTINYIDRIISEAMPVDYHTTEAMTVITTMYTTIKTALDDAEKAGVELA